MFKTLSLFAAFLWCCVPHVDAQKLVLSLKAGEAALLTNNAYKITADPSPLGGLNILCDLEDFQVGGALFYGRQQFHADEPLGVNAVTEEYINTYLLANYKINMKHAYVYMGVNFGIYSIRSQDRTYAEPGFWPQKYIAGTNEGLGLGIQAGYCWLFSKHFSLSAEVQATHFRLNYMLLPYANTNLLRLPLLLGFNYIM